MGVEIPDVRTQLCCSCGSKCVSERKLYSRFALQPPELKKPRLVLIKVRLPEQRFPLSTVPTSGRLIAILVNIRTKTGESSVVAKLYTQTS